MWVKMQCHRLGIVLAQYLGECTKFMQKIEPRLNNKTMVVFGKSMECCFFFGKKKYTNVENLSLLSILRFKM